MVKQKTTVAKPTISPMQRRCIDCYYRQWELSTVECLWRIHPQTHAGSLGWIHRNRIKIRLEEDSIILMDHDVQWNVQWTFQIQSNRSCSLSLSIETFNKMHSFRIPIAEKLFTLFVCLNMSEAVAIISLCFLLRNVTKTHQWIYSKRCRLLPLWLPSINNSIEKLFLCST